jgi:hypothetical protein
MIYPKKGEPFCLGFARFGIDGRKFSLYDNRNAGAEPSKRAFLSVDHVAAIIPTELTRGRFGDERRFRVHLKGRPQTIEVIAHEFEPIDPSTQQEVVFYWQHVGSEMRREQLEDIYIAAAEVLAILPSAGLGY